MEVQQFMFKPRLAIIPLLFPVMFGDVVQADTSIVGSWFGQDLGQAQSTVDLTFLSDGHFFLVNNGSSTLDPSGQPGLEYGTYSWNSTTGAFSATDLVSTVGGWQSMPNFTNLSVSVSGLSVDGGLTLSSIPSVNDSILGSWYGNNLGQAQDNIVVTYLANGVFYQADVGNHALDPTGQDGIEVGAYTWNTTTKAYTDTVLLDTNGQWGQSNAGITSVAVTGNTATYTGNAGNFEVYRVSSVPLPGSIWMFATSFVVLLGLKRRKQ